MNGTADAGQSPSGRTFKELDKLRSVAEAAVNSSSDQPDDLTRKGQVSEQKTQRKALSAGLRAEDAHAQHIQELRSQRDKLEEKLDRAEQELQTLRPRVAVLEQAMRSDSCEKFVSGITTIVGGVLMACYGVGSWQNAVGIAISLIGLLPSIASQFWARPK